MEVEVVRHYIGGEEYGGRGSEALYWWEKIDGIILV